MFAILLKSIENKYGLVTTQILTFSPHPDIYSAHSDINTFSMKINIMYIHAVTYACSGVKARKKV